MTMSPHALGSQQYIDAAWEDEGGREGEEEKKEEEGRKEEEVKGLSIEERLALPPRHCFTGECCCCCCCCFTDTRTGRMSC